MGRLDGKIALISGTGRAVGSADLSTADGARCWISSAVEYFGGVDVLYNNASALRNGPLLELSDEDWHFTIRNELDLVCIWVNAILPGLIYTPETARFIDDPAGPLPQILARIPLGRYGHAHEVAKLAAFLASDDAAFITGAEIAIDGGDGSVAA